MQGTCYKHHHSHNIIPFVFIYSSWLRWLLCCCHTHKGTSMKARENHHCIVQLQNWLFFACTTTRLPLIMEVQCGMLECRIWSLGCLEAFCLMCVCVKHTGRSQTQLKPHNTHIHIARSTYSCKQLLRK